MPTEMIHLSVKMKNYSFLLFFSLVLELLGSVGKNKVKSLTLFIDSCNFRQ